MPIYGVHYNLSDKILSGCSRCRVLKAFRVMRRIPVRASQCRKWFLYRDDTMLSNITTYQCSNASYITVKQQEFSIAETNCLYFESQFYQEGPDVIQLQITLQKLGKVSGVCHLVPKLPVLTFYQCGNVIAVRSVTINTYQYLLWRNHLPMDRWIASSHSGYQPETTRSVITVFLNQIPVRVYLESVPDLTANHWFLKGLYHESVPAKTIQKCFFMTFTHAFEI